MALPTILPYPMPTAADLPNNRVNWKPDPKRAVLLIHDMQQYFVDAFTTGSSPVTELIANIQTIRAVCEEMGIPVIYSAQPGGQTVKQRGLLQDFWGSGINDGPYQKQIIKQLEPSSTNIVLTKWRYSAFQRTNLRELLVNSGRDQIIVCGIYAHIGCLMTACEAFMQDVEPFFVADAVADFSLDKHQQALIYAAERCAVTLTTSQLLERMGGASIARELESSEVRSGVMTKEKLCQQVAGLLHESPSDIGEHDDLVEVWGLDSIRIMSLVEKWRRSDLLVTFVEIAERPTLADWWQLLSSREAVKIPNADYYSV
ncbi:isochorismatase family protein [Paenibacillus sp. N1-5-1-14]|uniref:isochorismatase family protein n=1 Tax=Paenibacillus radicibacter TaxID=2972488 RepID=UPI002159B395|nr:isochorismatase family protein [Paenibacillus radicibacter]MCR8642844.1 isochorismatase family protein [Paenibacillus radicibacter]